MSPKYILVFGTVFGLHLLSLLCGGGNFQMQCLE